MLRFYFILFLLIASAVDSRLVSHRTLSKHSLYLKETETDPNIKKILANVPEGIIPKLLETLSIHFSVVIPKKLDLYKQDILGFNLATISLPKNGRLSLSIDPNAILISSTPSFVLSVPGPDFRIPSFRYDFDTAEFEAILDGGWTIANVGVRHAILKHAIESHLNSEIKSKFPERVRVAGYRFAYDSDKLGTLNELKRTLTSISSTHDTDSDLPPITINELKKFHASVKFQMGTDYRIPIPNLDNYSLFIPQRAYLAIFLETLGSLSAPRLHELTIKTLGSPRISIRTADDSSGLRGLDFYEITVRPDAQINFDYRLGIEQFTSTSIDILRYIMRRLGRDTPAAPADIRLRQTRERLDRELQSIREPLITLMRQYSELIPGYNLVDFFNIQSTDVLEAPTQSPSP